MNIERFAIAVRRAGSSASIDERAERSVAKEHRPRFINQTPYSRLPGITVVDSSGTAVPFVETDLINVPR